MCLEVKLELVLVASIQFPSHISETNLSLRFGPPVVCPARSASLVQERSRSTLKEGRKAAEEGQLLVAVPAPQQLKLCADVDGVHGQRRGIEEVEQAHLEREDNLAI